MTVMKQVRYYDTFPDALKALEAAVLLGLSFELRNVVRKRMTTVASDLEVVQYQLAVSSENASDALNMLQAAS